MMILAAAVGVITLAIPYTPLASLFGFAPLPVGTLALILLIVCAYFISAEIAKRAFYRQMRNQV
jgi:Mg2+-importing ATPase